MALAGLISLSMMPAFGWQLSCVFASVAIFINGLCMHLFNFFWLLPLAHPVHGWHKHHPEEFRLGVVLTRLEELAKVDVEKRGG